MHPIDWTILLGFTAWIVYDGLKRTKDSHEIEGYFLAKRSIPWWAAGISVMATQLSAITMIGTTGQGIQRRPAVHPVLLRAAGRDDHPLGHARAVLLPLGRLHGLRVSSSGGSTRRRGAFTSLLFLVSRGMSCGAVVSAPAVVLSLVLGPGSHRDLAAHHAARRRLHDVRRRAGRDLDRREDHGPDRHRAGRR